MKKLNENINRLRTLMSLNEYSKVSDTYDNVDFKDKVVGGSTPSQDRINPSLLSDVQKAAKRAGVTVDITTAISGHESSKSRHTTGDAVDIAIINGKAVSYSNRKDADAFVNELVKMGYVKNKEVGNSKAVLTFGFPKHDNHVHVSNTSGSSSDSDINTFHPDTDTEENDNLVSSFVDSLKDDTNPNITSQYADTGMSKILGLFLPEQKNYGSFGSREYFSGGDLILPKGSNKVIKSPVSGEIDYYTADSSCSSNNVTIKHDVDGDEYLLSFCGLDEIKVTKGQEVDRGTILGTVNDDITVTLFNSRGKKQNLERFLKNTPKSKEEESSKKSNIFFTGSKPKDSYTTFSGSNVKKDKNSDNIHTNYKTKRNPNPEKSQFSDEMTTTLLNLPVKMASSFFKKIKEKTPLKHFKSITSEQVEKDIEKIKKLLK
jgi:murein DD-endopeptidase MepM/ murein hydrolase activator NlpD